jgi:DnaK suppressor protein
VAPPDQALGGVNQQGEGMSLTEAQRTQLEQRLQEERARALQILNQGQADRGGATEQDVSGDLTKMPFHLADLGTDTMDSELDASNATRVSRELAQIDDALERLYRTPEEYGVCQDTGRDIPFERLVIIPWARTCD